MMQERQIMAEPLQHTSMVEAILGVPLAPEELDDVPITPGTVREFVYRTVVETVQHKFAPGTNSESLELDKGTLTRLQAEPLMRRLAAEVQTANDTLLRWHRPPELPADADTPDTNRGRFQARAMQQIVEHAQRAPTIIDEETSSPYRRGLLTMAPPGAGKTVLQALGLNYAGVGLPVSAADPRPRKAVGIVNSQLLVRQGLDPSETLQRFSNIGGRTIRIGAYFQDRRDGHDEYDMLLTTPDSYPNAVGSGAINTETTVRYFLDEAHRSALAPSMQRHITRFGSGLYMFTATPAIAGGRRDLRNQFPYSQFGSLREFVEDGILSPIRLFSYREGPENDSVGQLATSLAADHVRGGRKTLVVCQPGKHLAQARDIAARLNQHYEAGSITPHPRFNWKSDKIACAVGMFPGSNTKADLEYLRRGERLVATTVATGNEGLNIVDLDALIIIGPQGATWVVDQWLGRILRPSGRLAIASEILPAKLKEGKPLASIFGSFGMHHETIESGYYIGRRTPGELPEFPDPTITPTAPNDQAPAAAQPARSRQPEEPTAEHASATELYTPPMEALAALVTGISVREATIAPADLQKLPPPDYKPLTPLAPEGVPVEWLYNIMDKQEDPQVRYVGTWEPDEAGKIQYIRHYSPAAHAYFVQHPLPELARATELLDEQIARMLHVSRNYVRDTFVRLGIEPLERITKYHRKPRYYGFDALAAITGELADIPLADETDVAVADLEQSTSKDYARDYINDPQRGITAVDKRRHPTWGLVGITPHITGAEARTVREAYQALAVADKLRFISLGEIGDLAGVALSTVLNKLHVLPEDMKPQTTWLRSASKLRPSEHVRRSWGEGFAEYIKPEKILPWEATLGMVAAYFGKQKLNMSHILNRRPAIPQPQRLPLPGISDAVIYPLSVIIDLRHEGLRPVPDAPPVNAQLAALSARDMADTARVAYSQRVQRRFITHAQVAEPEELAYYVARRETPPALPDPSLTTDAEISDTSAPDNGANDTVYDIGFVRSSTDCTPEAFTFLLQRADLDAHEVVEQEGAIVSLRGTAMQKLRQLSRQVEKPPAGWLALTEVAHKRNITRTHLKIPATIRRASALLIS